jgi:P27 family predicted phage terminase small subunit
MISGPAPKPTALKDLAGNPGKRARNHHEPKPRRVRPRCPHWLDPRARAIWQRYAPALERLGLLTEIDGAVFEVLCQSYARWRQAEDALDEHGITFETEKHYVVQRPEVIISRNERRRFLDAAAQLGLTPSARSRISVVPPDPADELEVFLNERTRRKPKAS